VLEGCVAWLLMGAAHCVAWVPGCVGCCCCDARVPECVIRQNSAAAAWRLPAWLLGEGGGGRPGVRSEVDVEYRTASLLEPLGAVRRVWDGGSLRGTERRGEGGRGVAAGGGAATGRGVVCPTAAACCCCRGGCWGAVAGVVVLLVVVVLLLLPLSMLWSVRCVSTEFGEVGGRCHDCPWSPIFRRTL